MAINKEREYRIAWDGERVLAVANIDIKEIDGVIDRLKQLRKALDPDHLLSMLPAQPKKLILPREIDIKL